MSKANIVQYHLCAQCYDHLVEKKKDYHSEIFACIWQLLSGTHKGKLHQYDYHRVVTPEKIWNILPVAMRKWWFESVQTVGCDAYTSCRVDDPCIFNDPTVEYDQFRRKLSGDDVSIATLRDALDSPSMMNRQVLCPWSCSCNVRTSGRVGFDVILQRIFQDIIIKPTAANMNKYTQVQSSWEQFVRHVDDYDSIMYNRHNWKVMPHVIFDTDGPYVLTCPHHDGGTPYLYLYPPRSPHLFNANTTDQVSPFVVIPRIHRPLRRNPHSTSFAMHKMHCNFKGADTMDLTEFSDFSARTKGGLIADHYALIVAGRPDICSHMQNLEKKQLTVEGWYDTIKTEGEKRYPKESLKRLAQGATYTTFHDSMALHLEGGNEISVTGMRKRTNYDAINEDDGEEGEYCEDNDPSEYTEFDISCRRPWARKILLVQMEDVNGYGIQPFPVPQYDISSNAALTTWILSALLMGSKELWDIVQAKSTPFHVWGWEGWLLTYLDTTLPFQSTRADPKITFQESSD